MRSRGVRLAAGLGFAVIFITLTSCNAGTVRPPFRPMGAAVVDTIPALREPALEALAREVDAAGVPSRTYSPIDGFLETAPYDVDAQQPGSGTPAHPERSVVMRFWVDPLPGDRSRVTAEATYRTTADPSLDRRLAEAMVSRDHPGFALLRRILDEAKANVVR